MKRETLLESMNHIDEGLLMESEQALNTKSRHPLAWAATAAALVAVLGLGYLGVRLALGGRNQPTPAAEVSSAEASDNAALLPDRINPPESRDTAPTEAPPEGVQERELPVLEAGDSFHESALRRADEIETPPELWTASGLWTTESDFQTLPVFETREQTYDSEAPILDDETMQQVLREEAVRLGLGELDFIQPAVYNLPNNATLPEDAMDYVGQSGTELIAINKAGRVLLLCGEQHRAMYESLSEEIKTKLKTDPHYARQFWAIALRSALELPYLEPWELEAESTEAASNPRYASGRTSDDGKELYLGYALRNVELELSPDGDLVSVRYDACFRERYLPLGDYPVIPYAEAEQLAKNAQYFTDGMLWEGYEFSWNPEDGLYQADLIYNELAPHRIRMPYYRFYVAVRCTPVDFELAGPDATEQTVYMPIYVPAIQAEYLRDFPLEAQPG